MGRFVNGINGPIVGKVGTVIGSSRNGKPYVKGPHKKRTKKISKKESGNRNKFKIAQAWLKPVLEFVRDGFYQFKMTSGAFVAAKGHLLRHAFEGVQPDIRINPALVKVSVGELPLSPGIAAGKAAPGLLQFTWDTAPVAGGSAYDQVMLLAYDIDKGFACYNTTGQFRSAGADTLAIEAGRSYHLYLAFTSADRKLQSDSVYLGVISM